MTVSRRTRVSRSLTGVSVEDEVFAQRYVDNACSTTRRANALAMPCKSGFRMIFLSGGGV